MRLTLPIFLVFAAVAAAQPVPPGAKKDAAQALEEKLHGEWKGAACMGTITFKVGGTYNRAGYTPARIALSGDWTVRWDALPPPITLKCSASDEDDRIGVEVTAKIVELNDETLSIRYSPTR